MLLLAAITAYLLGSVPFGIVITRAFGLGDLRRIGSGNIGATNVLRTGSRAAAALTLICDVGKGAFSVGVAYALIGPQGAQIAGFAAFLGHCYPIYLGFRGGKGVATFLGTVLALAWPIGLAVCATWLAAAAAFRISSLAALIAAAAAPFYAMFLGQFGLAAGLVAMGVLIFLRHRANISRLLSGTEPRIGKSS